MDVVVDTTLTGIATTIKDSLDMVGHGVVEGGLGSPNTLMCDEDLSEVLLESPKVWPCPDCPAACDNRALLGAHIREVHIHPDRVTVHSVSVAPTDAGTLTGHALVNTEPPVSVNQASPVLMAPLPLIKITSHDRFRSPNSITTKLPNGTTLHVNVVDGSAGKTPKSNKCVPEPRTLKLFECEVCTFPCASPGGLSSHTRAKHKEFHNSQEQKIRKSSKTLKAKNILPAKGSSSKQLVKNKQVHQVHQPLKLSEIALNVCTVIGKSEQEINRALDFAYRFLGKTIQKSTEGGCTKSDSPTLLDVPPIRTQNSFSPVSPLLSTKDECDPITISDSPSPPPSTGSQESTMVHPITISPSPSPPSTGSQETTRVKQNIMVSRSHHSASRGPRDTLLNVHPSGCSGPEYEDNMPYTNVFLASQNLARVPIKSDGHCMLHAVEQCLNATAFGSLALNEMKELVRSEIKSNKTHYAQFGELIEEEIEKYLDTKEYTSNTADLIPNLLSTSLNINICIVTSKKNNMFDLVKVRPGREHPFDPNRITITVIRSNHDGVKNLNTHYDAAVPLFHLHQPLQIVSQSEGDCILKCAKSNVRYHLFRSPSLLSNFSRADIDIDGVHYTCNEQNIMANRFPEDHVSSKMIMQMGKPLDMKREGGKARVPLSQDIASATLGLWAKYSNNARHRSTLLNTGDQILVEGTHNSTWGIGRDIQIEPQKAWVRRSSWKGAYGVGVLGVLTMIIREDLKKNNTEPSWSLIEALFSPQPKTPYVTPNPSSITSVAKEAPGQSVREGVMLGPSSQSCGLPSSSEQRPSSIHNTPPVVESWASVARGNYTQPPSRVVNKGKSSLLNKRGLFIPPNHMSCREVLSRVWEQEPSLAKWLTIEKGKITSHHTKAQARLKLPLLPGSHIKSLRFPLPRAYRPGSVRQTWLTQPLDNKDFNLVSFCEAPEIVAMRPFQWDNSHTIYLLTTAFMSENTSPEQDKFKHFESGTKCIKLTKFNPIERCTFCQSLGHSKLFCAFETPTCVSCAGGHESHMCPKPSRIKCGRCGGRHKASSTICPDYNLLLKQSGCQTLGSSSRVDIRPRDTDPSKTVHCPNRIPDLMSLPLPSEDRMAELFPFSTFLNSTKKYKHNSPSHLTHPDLGMSQSMEGVIKFSQSTQKTLTIEKVLANLYPGNTLERAIHILKELAMEMDTNQTSGELTKYNINPNTRHLVNDVTPPYIQQILIPILEKVKFSRYDTLARNGSRHSFRRQHDSRVVNHRHSFPSNIGNQGPLGYNPNHTPH